MPHYNKLYTFLFGRVTDAIEALEQGNPDQAKGILIEASMEAEELYLADDPECSEYPAEPMTGKQYAAIMGLLREKGDFGVAEALARQYPELAEYYEEAEIEK